MNFRPNRKEPSGDLNGFASNVNYGAAAFNSPSVIGEFSDDMPSISMTVNGQAVTGEVEGRTLLVEFLRDTLGLTGTHVGCDTSQCGACVIHLDGVSVKSCAVLALNADGAEVLTIEGVADGDDLHPMQEAFRDHHGLQCGFCTPGMVLTALALVADNPDPTDAEVRHGLEGNLCRCTGYQNIVHAILDGAKRMRG